MARAILHIGLHKTATTLVQHSFAANRRLLARHGLIYPDIGPTEGHHALLTPWVPLDRRYRSTAEADRLWAGLARHAGPDTTLLLSSEEFSRGRTHEVDLAAVRARLAAFDRVEVVCVLRDQVALLQSVWMEVAKKGTGAHFFAMLTSALNTGYATAVHMNLRPLYRRLRRVFAADAIRFLDYATARAAPGGLPGALLDACGAGAATPDLAPVAPVNVSPDPLALWIARWDGADPAEAIAGTGTGPARPVPAGRVADARAALDARARAGRPTTLYTRAERREMETQMAARNAVFLDMVRPHQPDLALSPPADPAPGTIFRDDLGDLDPLPPLSFGIAPAPRAAAGGGA